MIRIGRFTAALVLVVVGSLLLVDQLFDTSFLALLFQWWPLVLISLGAEYLLLGAKHRQGDKPLKLDVGGVFFALLISVIVVVVTQNSTSFQFLKNMKLDNITDFASSIGESGHKFEKDVVRIPLASGTESITINDLNGSVVLRSGPVDGVEVQATVFVDKVNEERAKEIADRSRVAVTEGTDLKIEALSEKYDAFGISNTPRINLVITLPKESKTNVRVTTRNGKLEASDLILHRDLRLNSTNGSITLADIQGDVFAETTNGRVSAESIQGDAELRSTNGSIRAKEVKGTADLMTTNGEVVAENIGGSLKARSTNGGIKIEEVMGSIHADTSNSRVSVTSAVMGGDWKLETTNGKIEANLPADASFRAEGRSGHGSISSDFPGLSISEKRLTGTVGSGEHKLELETSGSISVKSIH
jgi:DUF4097 and DUF4098 domain-containing protein YvlB